MNQTNEVTIGGKNGLCVHDRADILAAFKQLLYAVIETDSATVSVILKQANPPGEQDPALVRQALLEALLQVEKSN